VKDTDPAHGKRYDNDGHNRQKNEKHPNGDENSDQQSRGSHIRQQCSKLPWFFQGIVKVPLTSGIEGYPVRAVAPLQLVISI
jgi:hypothetical protein